MQPSTDAWGLAARLLATRLLTACPPTIALAARLVRGDADDPGYGYDSASNSGCVGVTCVALGHGLQYVRGRRGASDGPESREKLV